MIAGLGCYVCWLLQLAGWNFLVLSGVVLTFILTSKKGLQIIMINDVQAVRLPLDQTHFDAIIDGSNFADLSAVQVRCAVPEDAEVCGRIGYEAFATISEHHRFPPDISSAEAGIELLHIRFSHPQFYCVVAEIDGQIIGSNCLDERSTIAGIGPIMIAPNAQNRSIGRLLMRAVMNRAAERGFAGLRLAQSAFYNRSLSLYTKLGFDARELIAVMQGPPIKRSLQGWRFDPQAKAIWNQQRGCAEGYMASTGSAS